jgi:hypothetical protein
VADLRVLSDGLWSATLENSWHATDNTTTVIETDCCREALPPARCEKVLGPAFKDRIRRWHRLKAMSRLACGLTPRTTGLSVARFIIVHWLEEQSGPVSVDDHALEAGLPGVDTGP